MTEIITEIELYNEEANYEVSVSVSWEWVDNGIGTYEFWGTPSIDVRMELEQSGFYIDSVSFDEECGGGVAWTMEHADKTQHPKLWKEIELWVEDQVAELDPPEAYYGEDEDDYYDERYPYE